MHGSTAQNEQNRLCLAEGYQLLVALTSKTEIQTVAKLETHGGSFEPVRVKRCCQETTELRGWWEQAQLLLNCRHLTL